MATSPSFMTEDFPGFNDEGFGTLIESCYKTTSSPQIKYASQEERTGTMEFEDFVEEKRQMFSSNENLLLDFQQPRSLGTIEVENWENKTGNNFRSFDKSDDNNSVSPASFSELHGFEFTIPEDSFLHEIHSGNGVDQDTHQLYYSLVKQGTESMFRQEPYFCLETSNQESFSNPVESYDVQNYDPYNDLQTSKKDSNYTYSSNNDIVDIVSPAVVNPFITSNSTASTSTNKVTCFLQSRSDEDFLSYPKFCKSRFMKGSKNRLCIQREFSYEGVDVEKFREPGDYLINSAKNEEPHNFQDLLSNKLLELKVNKEHNVCWIRRDRYIRRDLNAIQNLYENVGYELNPKFHISKPYEPQYIRFEIDHTNGLPFNETRSGLCPYCPELSFKNLKTSTYSQHLALTHGVYTDNYLTPNPLYYGVYIIKKTNTQRRTKAHEHERCGVVCPCCYTIVGTECSKTTASSKPLNNYMRHFKEFHRQSRDKLDPIKFFCKTVTLNKE